MDKGPVETTTQSLDDSTSAPLRPRDERHVSLLRVGSLMIGKRRELCLIRNISAGGMMIRAYSKIKPGARVTIELKEGEPVAATAKWAKDDQVGLEFDKPIDVSSLLSTSAEELRPRMPRVEVDCMALVREGAVVHRTRVVDVSQGGVRVVTSKELSLGAEVTVTLTGLAPAPGTVRWKEGESYGITFNRPLALPALVGWLQQQQDRGRARTAG